MSTITDQLPAPTVSRTRLIAYVLLSCVVLAALEAAQTRAATVFRGLPLRGPLLMGFLSELPFWLAVAVLIPGIIAISRAFPLMEPETRWRALAVHAASSLVFPFIHLSLAIGGMLVLSAGRPHPPVFNAIAALLGTYYALEVLVYFMIAGGYSAVAWRERYRRQELAAASLSASLTEARLHALRTQLNPHFLFNTLNAIIELSAQNRNDQVGDVATRLAALLRTSLDDASHSTSFEQEVGFTTQYLDIERVRFGDRLRVIWDIPAGCERLQVPTLLLQPLVENAVKHAVSQSADPVTITISASVEQHELHIHVRDNGPGLIGGADALRAGVGLGNTRARLQQMYGDAGRMKVEALKGGGVDVHVTLPATDAP